MSTKHHCVTSDLHFDTHNMSAMSAMLVMQDTGPKAVWDKHTLRPGSTASLCYCQWLGADILHDHEASLPWQSPGEHNGTCTFLHTESAEKHTECQTEFQLNFCCFGGFQISCTFMPASSFWGMFKHMANVAGPSPC